MTNTKKLTYGGILGSLIFVGTWFLKIPIIHGYLNFGDGFIIISGMILGPSAFIPAAIGSSLADIVSGYTIYAPFTFVIKGLIGLITGYLVNKKELKIRSLFLVFILVETIMVLGYLATDTLLFTLKGAILSLPFNILQGIFAVLIGLIAVKVISRYKIYRF